MGNESFELATEWLALDPVNHESSIACSEGNAMIGVDIIEILMNIFPSLYKVFVWGSACKDNELSAGNVLLKGKSCYNVGSNPTPVILNSVTKLVSESCAACGIDSHYNIALIGDNLGVPSRTP